MLIMNKYVAFLISVALICVTAIVIFFNPYHYSMYGGKYPVRDNWITGKTEMLKNEGWIVLTEPAPKVGDVLEDGKVIYRSP